MYILGLSSFYHDSAACLIKNGEIIAAVQEERFTRVKHDKSFPSNSINYCLQEGCISINDIQHIVFYEKPFLKFERLLETYLAFAPKGFRSFSLAMPIWIKEKLFQKKLIIDELEKIFGDKFDLKDKILFSEHHLSHAASAFYPSPFEKAAVLTIDAVGEWTTTSIAVGNGKDLNIVKEIHFPHSLGLLYSAITYYTGFKVNSGEYKVMGLAPYGRPKYSEIIKKHLIKVKEDGSFKLNMKYFDYATGLTMTNKHFHNLFGGPPRLPESRITQKEMDLAASIQDVIEEVVSKIAKNISIETGEKNLCLAGGVALNCVCNRKLLDKGYFDNIWIQPAAGDAGGALGAALAVWHLGLGKNRALNPKYDSMKGAYLGPSYENDQIESDLISVGAEFIKVSDNKLLEIVVEEICKQKAVGWMQGRMEFGPRALGSRSIIADPRSESMQKVLNLKVKFRESFRPFAPSVLEEHINDWFDLNHHSPYMLLVAQVLDEHQISLSEEEEKLFGIDQLNVSRSIIPAVTHIDYSARLQSVNEHTNPIYHQLISKFYKQTGCPILINTSFNVRGEPIVCSPKDAFRCFMGTKLDILAIGNFILFKNKQNQSLLENYEDKYELD